MTIDRSEALAAAPFSNCAVSIQVMDADLVFYGKLQSELEGEASLKTDGAAEAADLLIIDPCDLESRNWLEQNAGRQMPCFVIVHISDRRWATLANYVGMRGVVAIIPKPSSPREVARHCRSAMRLVCERRGEQRFTELMMRLASLKCDSNTPGMPNYEDRVAVIDDIMAMRTETLFFSRRPEKSVRLLEGMTAHAERRYQGRHLMITCKAGVRDVYADAPLVTKAFKLMLDWAAAPTGPGASLMAEINARPGRSELSVLSRKHPQFAYGTDQLAETYLSAVAGYHSGRFYIEQTHEGYRQVLSLPDQDAALAAA